MTQSKFKNQMKEIAEIMKQGYDFDQAIEIHKQKTFEAHKFLMENSEEVKNVLKRLAGK